MKTPNGMFVLQFCRKLNADWVINTGGKANRSLDTTQCACSMLHLGISKKNTYHTLFINIIFS